MPSAVASRSAAKDRLAALREARAKGGRLAQWKVSFGRSPGRHVADEQPEDSDIYDEVSDDQYRSIVDSRLAQDDFVEDDDGSGYVDNGMDDWENEEEEESEDEDDFEGEDEELRKGSSHLRSLLTPSAKDETSKNQGSRKGQSSQRRQRSQSKTASLYKRLFQTQTFQRGQWNISSCSIRRPRGRFHGVFIVQCRRGTGRYAETQVVA